MKGLNRHDLFWMTYIGMGIGLDVWRDRCKDESTLSCRVRHRCKNRPGRAVFLLGWFALTAWLVHHILITPKTAPTEV